jgi:hypothetical protein
MGEISTYGSERGPASAGPTRPGLVPPKVTGPAALSSVLEHMRSSSLQPLTSSGAAEPARDEAREAGKVLDSSRSARL